MFIPIGMLLKLAFCNNDNHNVLETPKGEQATKGQANLNWKGAMFVGLLLSTAIEVSQFVFCKGLCEVDDMIHNVGGG